MKKLKITSLSAHLRYLSVLCFIMLLSACGQKEVEQNVSEELPESFKEFYKEFHRDSVYQMNHIVFPLQGAPNNASSNTDYSDFRWAEDDWVIHKDFGSLLDSYKKFYSGDSTYITEEIYHSSGAFKIERRFSRIAKQWYLVYYAGLSMQRNVLEELPDLPEPAIDIQLGE